ncbi:hypothetical protein UPYG_G00278650 [Umbra pygmaea]|uniref:Protein phosphatase 1 regulatory subunit 26 N-terminal domain-containing protein n=1 Tax=Umbra pygmaea TaxID=75934 RepID=A0ABD0W2Q7_UMBPY
MYLMNVPPVAAIHSEWRSSCGGPPRGFSGLPLCFNDSDSDLSTTGTPIPEKVQMIIESLRSTQSSLDMGDEMEGNQVLSGQPGLEAGARSSQGQGFKAQRRPLMVTGLNPKFKAPLPHSDILQSLPEFSSNANSESQSADSDDSSDGIEEAIQEYLKEKDDHKRKVEPGPTTNDLQPPKMPRREAPPPIPEPSKQHSDSNKVLTASNQVRRSLKTETRNTVPTSIKKRVRSKTATFKENPFEKMDTSKAAVVKKLASFEKKRCSTNMNPLSHKLKCPVLKSESLKVEENLSDSSTSSSSDDGIEEAIQRYQQEKKKERQEGGSRQSTKPLRHLKEEAESSSSSSDDGIEDAIRRYQLEKQKDKKSVTKLSLSLTKQKQVRKALVPQHGAVSPNTLAATMKKHQPSKKKKKKREARDVKSSPPFQYPGSSVSLVKDGLPASSPKMDSFLLSTKMESLEDKEQEPDASPGPATLNVNTTTKAELMCAEAILDISKAVIKMPEAFNLNTEGGFLKINSSPSESTSTSSLLISRNCPDEDRKSDGESSVDSEEGIEQEIRKFLEQKAQMHKLSPGPDSAIASTLTEPTTKAKLSPAQKKRMRLSLTQKKKLKDEANSRIGSREVAAICLKNEQVVQKPSTQHERPSPLSVSCLKSAPQSIRGLDRRREQSGDKSSSLDSDEDLDTAIKDLLKTKKKLKKKTTRDMKLKSRKVCKDEEPVPRKTISPSKNLSTESKSSRLLKTSLKITTSAALQSRNDRKKKGKILKGHHPQNNKKDSLSQADEMEQSEGNHALEGLSRANSSVVQIKEESSSVDSDDSIEQEIRRFLAEKAKVSTATVNKNVGQETGNSTGEMASPIMEKCIKSEDQLAEISRMDVTHFSEPPRQTSPELIGVLDRGLFSNTTPIQPMQGHSNPITPDTARGSCLASSLTPSSYPSTLEPADGAGSGTARAENSRSSSGSGSSDTYQTVSSEMARGRSTSLPRTESELRSPSQATPATGIKEKIHKRNPFQYSSPSFGEKMATTTAYQGSVPATVFQHRRSTETKPDTPVSTCPAAVRTGSSLRSQLVPFHSPSSLGTTSTSAAVFSSPFPSLTRRPAAMGPSGRYFLQGRGSGLGNPWGLSASPNPRLSESSVVHVANDQTTYVELSATKTNHVQIRCREERASQGMEEKLRELATGGKERESERGKESRRKEEKEGEQLGRQEEVCVDETDISESDESPEKKQGFPTLSLSSSIDPGITLSPYIALNTEERSRRFRWMCKAVAVKQPPITRIKKTVRRKLQFLPVSR